MDFPNLLGRVFCFVLLGVAVSGWSQATSGSINGKVGDPKGDLIPQARVEVTAQETGRVTVVETDAEGSYQAVNLPPGYYVVSVREAGFKRFATRLFELQIDQKLRIDITLTLGEVTETVAVTDVVPLMQTQSAANGQVIGSSDIANMPLLGRSFVDLMLLVPGVIKGGGGNNVNLSVNGQREFGNSFQVNGAEVTANRDNGSGLAPSVDAMREFKVVTSDYAPEFGRASGGVILLETKGGSNRFHGSAFEFYRPSNTAADTRGFGQSVVSNASQLQQHNYGGNIGGPLRKDRTFFFVSYERSQKRDVVPYTIPTPYTNQISFLSDGSADLSGLTDPTSGNQIPIYDPYFFQNNYYAQQYEENVIPAYQISPAGKLIVTKMFPKPNNSNTDYWDNFTAAQRFRNHGHNGNVRLDENLSANDRLAFTFDVNQGESYSGDPFEGSGTYTNIGGADSGDRTWYESETIGSSWSRTISANLLNDLHASYIIMPLVERGLLDGTRLADKLGIANANINDFPDTWSFPQIYLESGAVTGGSTWKPLRFRDVNLQLSDALDWNHGHHVFKLGYVYRHLNSRPDFSLFPEPYEYFAGADGAMTSDSSYSYCDYSAFYYCGGNEIADLLLGLPQVVYQGLQLTNPHTTSNEHSIYVQDAWQVTDRLNLNYGVRYEYRQPFVDANNNASNFDRDTLTVQIANRGSNSRSLVDSNKDDFMPRVGAAYRVSDQTTVRGGYGIFYSAENDAREDILTKNYPFFTQEEYINSSYYFDYGLDAGIARNTTINLSKGTSSIDMTTIPSATNQVVYSEPKNFPDGYSEMYNFTVQRMLPTNLSLEIGYVGSQAHRLAYQVGNYNINNHLSSEIGKVQTLLPVGKSNYNALQAKVERRYVNGWSVLGSYTYGHSLDNGPAPFDLGSHNTPQSPFDLKAEYASSDNDVTHNLTISNQLDLPFGRGKHYFRTAGPLTDAIVGGWHLNSIASFHTGRPVNITTGLKDFPGIRPNRVPGQNPILPHDKRTIKEWFNVAAFDLHTPGQTDQSKNPPSGTSGRNIVRAPGYSNEDLSLFKNFPLPKETSMQFRVESFNLLNTPHYGSPNAVITKGGFGAIQSAGEQRIFQFALKYVY